MSPIGRNDPCPCGSGKKYKHCCLRKGHGSHHQVTTARGAQPILNALQSGIAHQHAGRLFQAADEFRKALRIDPKHPDALNLLGMACYQLGNSSEALDLLRRSVALYPEAVAAHINLGIVHQTLGQLDEAAGCYRRATMLKPDLAEAHYNLGTVLARQGMVKDAIGCYGRAIQLAPNNAAAYNNLGNILLDQDRPEEAILHYRKALEAQPGFIEAYYNLGSALQKNGGLEEAADCYRKVLALRPDYPEALNNLGSLLKDHDKWDEAISCFRRALAVKPDYAEAYSNLGSVLANRGSFDEALTCLEAAVALKPGFAGAHGNLANLFTEAGKLKEAADCYRKAFAASADPSVHSNFLLMRLYEETCSSADCYAESQYFSERFEDPLRHDWRPHTNLRDPFRRLRVGYVSPDFRRHSVSYFFQPIIANHDKTRVETFCYHNSFANDFVTQRIAAAADHWLPCGSMTDQQLADRIRADSIDILVDLAGHTAHNRLLVFCRKPAPVQITYLGYPATTGLSTIDYRLTDNMADPVGADDAHYTERLIRLPDTFLCFQPDADSPGVGPLPSTLCGRITFGSFNHLPKILPMIPAWARILLRCPNSRLAIKAGGLQTTGLRQRLTQHFAEHGIGEERLILLGKDASTVDHLARYNQIDIALDSHPYNGATTTCEALWMGVPVVTLAGNRHVARVGTSLLSVAGLTELVTVTVDDYVDTAVSLASDVARLQAIRSGLRQRLRQSPLLDGPRLSREIEKVYRDIWVTWCNRDSPTRL